ncbi:MAG: helix-turn-helix domain-containing protein [Vicinamibacterales bacterium]
MDPRVARTIAVMDEALDRPLSLVELAVMVNLSRSQLARLFKEQTGTSPARYLHELRLARARLLLERTFLSVKQVMACVGLNDPSHFSRDFRHQYGFPPSELRQRSWTADASPYARAFPPSDRRNGHER